MRTLMHGTERGGRGALRTLALLIFCVSLLAVPSTASAADFSPAPGTYTANTQLNPPTITNGAATVVATGTVKDGVAVFSFGDVNIVSGVTINAPGTVPPAAASRPLKIVATGDLTMAGFINASGTSPSTDFQSGVFAGGAGGGNGGNGGQKGSGPGGGGKQPTISDGGGGGGFGGSGARGGKSGVDGATTGIAPAGPAYGNLNGGPLQGGSGGAGGSDAGGGGGGGAVALFGGGFVTVPGAIVADGGSGISGGNGASAGGSGGGILLHGETVDVTNGFLSARGGSGGAGGCCGDGGGGGGGRIAYQFRNLGGSGFTQLQGGASGTRSSSCCSSGGASADANGGAGAFTKKQAATATTGDASGLSSSAVTLNGAVNPRGSAASYHFDFGRTTAYGTRVPGSDASAGSGTADRAVAAAVGGLSPTTTYHYRLVVTDALGFVTLGTDRVFTTPAAPPPPPTGGGGGGTTPPPPALIPSTVSNNWLAFPAFTKVTQLSVNNLLSGTTVKVTCKTKKKKRQKKGCPYKSKRFTTSGARAKLNLLKPFRKKKLPVATKITISVTVPGQIGKRFTYTMRKRKIPKKSLRCLPPGGGTSSCA